MQNDISAIDLYLKIRRFICKRWWIFVLVGLVGGVFGYVNTKLKPDLFEYQIVVSSQVVDKSDIYSQIFPILQNDGSKAGERLNRFFQCDGCFLSVDSYNIDTVGLNRAIVIDLTLSDTSKISAIQIEIYDYFSSISSFNAQFEARRKQNLEYLEVLNNEIDELNTYQENISRGKNSSFVFSGTHQELINLYEKSLDVESQLLSSTPVVVSSSDYYVPIERSPIKSSVLWAVVFGFLCLVFLSILELDHEARKISKVS